MLWNSRELSNEEFKRDLYIIRHRIEKQAIAAQIPALYLCSLSARSIIYKGMFLAEHLTDFYPDLLDPRFTSRFAIYHQSCSTNTFPTGGFRSRSASWHITPRSTPSPATPTG
jgi:glutamate synthase (NADPH) large chain